MYSLDVFHPSPVRQLYQVSNDHEVVSQQCAHLYRSVYCDKAVSDHEHLCSLWKHQGPAVSATVEMDF